MNKVNEGIFQLCQFTISHQWSSDRAPATETKDLGLIPSRVKSNTRKIGIHSFPHDIQQLKGQCKASSVCGRQVVV